MSEHVDWPAVNAELSADLAYERHRANALEEDLAATWEWSIFGTVLAHGAAALRYCTARGFGFTAWDIVPLVASFRYVLSIASRWLRWEGDFLMALCEVHEAREYPDPYTTICRALTCAVPSYRLPGLIAKRLRLARY